MQIGETFQVCVRIPKRLPIRLAHACKIKRVKIESDCIRIFLQQRLNRVQLVANPFWNTRCTLHKRSMWKRADRFHCKAAGIFGARYASRHWRSGFFERTFPILRIKQREIARLLKFAGTHRDKLRIQHCGNERLLTSGQSMQRHVQSY